MSGKNKNFGKRTADEEHSDAPGSSRARPEGYQSDLSEPINEVFNLDLKVEYSPAREIRETMSDVMLENVNSAVKNAAMKAAKEELSNQIKSVYKPGPSKNEEQEKIQIDNENYDAYKSTLEELDLENLECEVIDEHEYFVFKTEKSHETRRYFYKKAVDQLGFDHLASYSKSELVTLSKDECKMIFEGIQDGTVLKEQLGKFLKEKSKMTKSFELLVSCDLLDDIGTRIQWENASPNDNLKCGVCNMWALEDGDCECSWKPPLSGPGKGRGWWEYTLDWECDEPAFSEEHPIRYRNGIIMKLQSSSDGEGIQVKYVKDSESHFFGFDLSPFSM